MHRVRLRKGGGNNPVGFNVRWPTKKKHGVLQLTGLAGGWRSPTSDRFAYGGRRPVLGFGERGRGGDGSHSALRKARAPCPGPGCIPSAPAATG